MKFFCLITLISITIINFGCVTLKQGNIIKPYYKSVVEEKNYKNKNSVSIRINPIKFDEPSNEQYIPTQILHLFPILSLIPESDVTFINARQSEKEAFSIIKREPGEIEKILVEEIRKTGIFNEVSFQGNQKDYDVRGVLNFYSDYHYHYSGMGALPYTGLLVPSFVLPMATMNYSCQAHFEVISTINNNILFSKDYFFEENRWLGLLYSGHFRNLAPIFGRDIFPVIVKEFIRDLENNLK